MSPTVWVAIVGVVSTLITTTGVILVAFINNRKERADSAEQGALAAMEERLMGRDETIRELKEENHRHVATIERKDHVITELRDNNAELREDNARLREENRELRRKQND